MTTKSLLRSALLGAFLLTPSCADPRDAARSALADPDPEVRREAIQTLAANPDSAQAFLPAIVAALGDDAPSVRVAAAIAIQKLEPQNTVHQPILESALRAGQGPVFLEIGRAGGDAAWAVPTLIALLGDRRPPIRALSAQALGEIAPTDDRVRPALQRGLRDENAAVRKACRAAIDQAASTESPAPS